MESGDPATTIETNFSVTNGARLEFSWFFHTTVSPADGYDDTAGVTINGTPLTLITSGTTGQGVGEENTGWREFSLPLPPGQVDFGLWVKNDMINYQVDSQFAVDNIRVTYPAVPVGPAWVMMVSGLGFFSFIARRKKVVA